MLILALKETLHFKILAEVLIMRHTTFLANDLFRFPYTTLTRLLSDLLGSLYSNLHGLFLIYVYFALLLD